MKKIAIQGIQGSNHHIVAKKHYNNEIFINECLSFDALTDSLLQKESDEAVMAIENTIAGSIIPNYALIDKYNLNREFGWPVSCFRFVIGVCIFRGHWVPNKGIVKPPTSIF